MRGWFGTRRKSDWPHAHIVQTSASVLRASETRQTYASSAKVCKKGRMNFVASYWLLSCTTSSSSFLGTVEGESANRFESSGREDRTHSVLSKFFHPFPPRNFLPSSTESSSSPS